MKSKNRESIEDFDQDDMPCPCTICGEWFDLNDGCVNPRKNNETICETCADSIEKEIEMEEEIEDIKNELSDAEWTVKNCKERLLKLGVTICLLVFLSSCSMFKDKAARKYDRGVKLIKQSVVLGHKIDSTTTEEIDSAEFKGVELSGKEGQLPDMDSLRKYCQQLLNDHDTDLNVEIKPESTIKEENRPNKAENAVIKIQRQVCPQKRIQKRDSLIITIDGDKNKIPYDLLIEDKDGQLSYNLSIPDQKIPYVKKTVKSAQLIPDKKYSERDKYIWLSAAGLLGFFLCFLFVVVAKRVGLIK